MAFAHNPLSLIDRAFAEHSQVSVVGGNAEPSGCSFNTHTKELNFKMGTEARDVAAMLIPS